MPVPYHPPKKEASPVQIFLVSFAVSLVVLLAAVFFIMQAVFAPPGGQTAAEEDTQPAEEAGLPYQPSSRDALNVLVIEKKEGETVPFAYTLCRFDPADERIVLAAIPPETISQADGKIGSFGELYAFAGSRNAVLAAQNLIDCGVDRYVELDSDAAVALADMLGGLEYHFDEGYETERVSVPAGTHLLNGALLWEVANSPPEDQNPESWRLELAGELLMQRLDASAESRLDFFLETFWEEVKTDISRFDYTTRQKAIASFLRSENRRVEIYPLSGNWNQSRTEFEAGSAAIEELRGIFAPPLQE